MHYAVCSNHGLLVSAYSNGMRPGVLMPQELAKGCDVDQDCDRQVKTYNAACSFLH